jgi:hypothetical protein
MLNVFAAYAGIPCTLIFIIYKKRKEKQTTTTTKIKQFLILKT